MTRWSRRAAGCLSVLCLAGVLAVGFAPFASFLDRLTVHLFVLFGTDVPLAPDWMTPEDYGRVLNVAFFVPVGLSLAWWLRVRWGWALPLAVGLSMMIEVGQRVLPGLGRDPTLDDVACNVMGAAMGVVVVAALRSRRVD